MDRVQLINIFNQPIKESKGQQHTVFIELCDMIRRGERI